MRTLLISLLMLAILPRRAGGEDVVKMVTFNGLRPGAANAYDLALLHEVLERTRRDYGTYEVQTVSGDISLARAIQLALDGHMVNVLTAAVGQPVIEREMNPVPFPIDKGLLGYRVAFIDRRSQERLSRVQNIEDLRQLRFGEGSGWSDFPIWKRQRIPIATTSDYESLVPMLIHGRFDLYPRGLYEIAPELAAYGERYPDLAVEQHLLLHYPYCEAFYVSRSAPHLAARLTAGLNRMVADGSFDALFTRYFGKMLADLNLRRRVVIELGNPDLPAWVPLKRKELWFDPKRRLPWTLTIALESWHCCAVLPDFAQISDNESGKQNWYRPAIVEAIVCLRDWG